MNKYNARKTEYLGKMFDSKREAEYCKQLEMMKKATGNDKVISYETQVTYQITINKQKICRYIADFVVKYKNRTEVIDVKSTFTSKLPVFRLKKKLMKAVLGIEIIEVIN